MAPSRFSCCRTYGYSWEPCPNPATYLVSVRGHGFSKAPTCSYHLDDVIKERFTKNGPLAQIVVQDASVWRVKKGGEQ